MTAYRMMQQVRRQLEANGFETGSLKFEGKKPFAVHGWGTKDGKSWEEFKLDGIFGDVNGHRIEFGVDDSNNVQVEIFNWKHTLDRQYVDGELITARMSEQDISVRVQRIIEAYEAI